MTATSVTPDSSTPGKIVTFYSYKGGTGRSMALANIAWILASQNRRVLVIDWDLEAPGLHRYFYPFLDDCDLFDSPGLIDFFTDFAAAARDEARPDTVSSVTGPDPSRTWWESWTSLLRYTYRLNWEFSPRKDSLASRGAPIAMGSASSSQVFSKAGALPSFEGAPTEDEQARGGIDFVPAGRQGPEYAARVHGFDWRGFYDRLGGGVFLEAVKRRLRERYDYVLIDSRTGISDTSGICTVQMPDDLVVCFTLNQQSVKGAEAVAASAESQRRTKSGEPGLRIWPVPTRIELAEKDRLEAARDLARTQFQRYLGHLTRADRADYWGRVEILYQPYFAYEEVLAVFAERRRQTASMLASMEFLTGFLSGGTVKELGEMSEETRTLGLAKYLPAQKPTIASVSSASSTPHIYVSYASGNDRERDQLLQALAQAGMKTWSDRDIEVGEVIDDAIESALDSASGVIAIIGRAGAGPGMLTEIEGAMKRGKRVLPVLVSAEFDALPQTLRRVRALQVGSLSLPWDVAEVVEAARRLTTRPLPTTTPVDPEDPQKGQWGGSPTRSGRTLEASVREVSPAWFEIALRVQATDSKPLSGEVVFHVHPTFDPSTISVPVQDGSAKLRLSAWGAFTVGAEADEGKTLLELDLSQDLDFPELFRSR